MTRSIRKISLLKLMKTEQFQTGETDRSHFESPCAADRIASLEALVDNLRSDLAKLARLCPSTAGPKSSDDLYDIYRRNAPVTAQGYTCGK
jgi:hypothetical protein